MPTDGLTPARPSRGQPLYLAACAAIRKAIDSEVFAPGRRLPSTKLLAKQLKVSLVTAHRALQELVQEGVLRRAQGKGTFVHERYGERRGGSLPVRIGLISPAEDALDSYYRIRVFEGIRQAAHLLAVDLLLLGLGEDVRSECNGLLLLSPRTDKIPSILSHCRATPALVMGVRSNSNSTGWIDIDNFELARRAVNHFYDLGHRNIGFVGGEDEVVHAHDRWRGFLAACQERGLVPRDQSVIRALTWRLDEREHMALIRLLSSPNRPTALFAAGYDFAMDVYGAARTVGLTIPKDLSMIGVDDTPSTPNLDPPMTTFRQPLIQLGHAAVTALVEHVRGDGRTPVRRTLRAELIVRGSTGTAT